MPALSRKAVQVLINAALREDEARRDLTSQRVIPPGLRVRARIITKAPGILAGGPVAVRTFQTLDRSLRCVLKRQDGSRVKRGDTILTVEGRARSIFAAERTALNFLGHLSGIATLTRRYVERVRGTRAQIFDTRKTLPGLRALEKYAVRAGGGHNHRADLVEAILIKTNHLRALRKTKFGIRNAEFGIAIQRAVAKAKKLRPKRFVQIEVTNLAEFRAALQAKPNAVLLDNWPLSKVRRAVVLKNSAFPIPHSALRLEVSGGVTLDNVRRLAKAGADRISIGRLTHSSSALDVSLQVL
ncbi:MAG: carboxylating nicotinate-nucleotide diphosphorylase [Candidatus Omnitrophica bacterium]|nr:carboxylating nicotinate-nucleotide diphosphorylase [Candidatus Omnitrophota bacterium]